MIGILIALGVTLFVVIAGLGMGILAISIFGYALSSTQPVYMLLAFLFAAIAFCFIRVATYFVTRH